MIIRWPGSTSVQIVKATLADSFFLVAELHVSVIVAACVTVDFAACATVMTSPECAEGFLAAGAFGLLRVGYPGRRIDADLREVNQIVRVACLYDFDVARFSKRFQPIFFVLFRASKISN